MHPQRSYWLASKNNKSRHSLPVTDRFLSESTVAPANCPALISPHRSVRPAAALVRSHMRWAILNKCWHDATGGVRPARGKLSRFATNKPMPHFFLFLTIVAYVFSLGSYSRFLRTGREISGRLGTVFLASASSPIISLCSNARAARTPFRTTIFTARSLSSAGSSRSFIWASNCSIVNAPSARL